MPKFKVGDRVHLLIEKEPYGSNYAGSPKVMIPCRQEGIVGAVDCAPIYGCRSFICVDFFLPGIYHFGLAEAVHESNQNWRCAVYPDQIEVVK